MHKVRYIVAIGAAAIGAAGAFYWGTTDRETQAKNYVQAAEGGTKSDSSESLPGRSGEVRNLRDFDDDHVAGPSNRAGSQVGSTAAVAHAENMNLDSGVNSPTTSSGDDDMSVPKNAAFPIAESIQEECASDEDLYFDCPGVRRALKRISEERSDAQWAPAMESRIRVALAAVPGVHIRALACRSSVCAVETDGAFVTSNAWTPLENDLLDSGYVRAHERTGRGDESFRVQLWTFKRRR